MEPKKVQKQGRDERTQEDYRLQKITNKEVVHEHFPSLVNLNSDQVCALCIWLVVLLQSHLCWCCSHIHKKLQHKVKVKQGSDSPTLSANQVIRISLIAQ